MYLEYVLNFSVENHLLNTVNRKSTVFTARGAHAQLRNLNSVKSFHCVSYAATNKENT